MSFCQFLNGGTVNYCEVSRQARRCCTSTYAVCIFHHLLRMMITRRNFLVSKLVLTVSRRSRLSRDNCRGVAITGRAVSTSSTITCGNVTLALRNLHQRSGDQHTDTHTENDYAMDRSRESPGKFQEEGQSNNLRAGRDGLARGEPRTHSPAHVSEVETPLHSRDDSTRGAQGSHNWMDYQAGLQMKAGLVPPEGGRRGPGGSTGRGNGSNGGRLVGSITRGRTKSQQTAMSGKSPIKDKDGGRRDTTIVKDEVDAFYASREMMDISSRSGESQSNSCVVETIYNHREQDLPSITGEDRNHRNSVEARTWMEATDSRLPSHTNDETSVYKIVDQAGQMGLSHSNSPGSAWQNVHVRSNLSSLMKGLANDYGVTEGAKERSVTKRTLSKVLPIFCSMVLDEPNAAFPGGAGQEIQRELTELCYHPGFRADVVTRRRPLRVVGSSGRSFSLQTRRGKTSDPFAVARNRIVEEVFIPKIVQLAKDHFPYEVESARIMHEAVDLTNPHEWYPLARLRKRRIIYHGGPTNSGKTFNAISRLKEAGANRKHGDGPAGIFCGPLRLLALEVYEQLNSQGIYCSLNTGQEKRDVPFATHVSCTIEMASTTTEYEVAVIDEIQMIADGQRGQIWTAALLGLNCPEIHLCGGLEAAKLVEALAADMGDDFELHQYERKTALVCAEESLQGNYANVQAGDAVVAFSRKDIFTIKNEIENKTPHKCCVVYGTLPQETRAHQARLFNTEETGYDVLVASDAIGMGLNLNIRRVIFHSVNKRTPQSRGPKPLSPTLLKQIGGRAGRHGKQWEFGEVTCLRDEDMAYMRHVMDTPLEPVPQARIFPIVQRVQTFAKCLDVVGPETVGRRSLADILETFAGEAKVGHRFILGEHHHQQKIADAMHTIENLTLEERFTVCMAPVNQRNEELIRAITLFAAAHANGLPAFVNMHLPAEGVLPRSVEEFQGICTKHAILEVYKWMANRFPTLECSSELVLAERQKEEVVSIIQKALKEDTRVTGRSSVGLHMHDEYDSSMLDAIKSPW